MARDADEVEWLDAKPAPEPSPPQLPRGVRYLLLGAVGVAVAVVLMLTSHPTKRAASPTNPISASSTSASTGAPSSNVPPTQLPAVISLGHPLLDVPPTWELVARSPDAVYQIQLATGRIVRISAPISGGQSVSFLVGPHEVVVRPWDCVNGENGYFIRDGHPATALGGVLADCGAALPGPGPGQAWVQNADPRNPRMVLVGLNGQLTGVSMPEQNSSEMPDGAGYALVTLVGGVYDARPDGLHRITTGRVLAAGPSGYLAEDCDVRHTCTMEVIGRQGGTHRVPGPAPDQFASGVISPDGTRAALVTQAATDTDTVVLHLVDLGSRTDHATRVMLSARQDPLSAMAWSPHSQWLFVADATGHIVAVDRTGRARDLDARLSAIEQLTVRG
jgi:hypothetical protein